MDDVRGRLADGHMLSARSMTVLEAAADSAVADVTDAAAQEAAIVRDIRGKLADGHLLSARSMGLLEAADVDPL